MSIFGDKRLVPKKVQTIYTIWTGSCKTWTGLKSGLWTGLDYGLDSGLDWTRGGMGAATLAIDYFIRDREVLVLWLQVSRSPGCCVICRCRSGYTRLGAVGVVSAV